MLDEVKPSEATIFGSIPPKNLSEGTILGAYLMKPFCFTPFGTKWLQTAPEVDGKILPNMTLLD